MISIFPPILLLSLLEMFNSLFMALLLPVLLLIFVRTESANAQITVFPSDQPTCVNEEVHLAFVLVQPNCDDALIAVCRAMQTRIDNNISLTNFRAIGNNGWGPCEVRLLFPDPPPQDLGYNDCIKGFWSITIDCMLIGKGKEAFKNRQAGVRGVAYEEGNNFTASDPASPGYMVGPPNYWPGQEDAEELELPGNA
ncbi:MAG: hypothetical protein LQ341_002181 [Variospora aurantia]|nr:MAG: hypothetical protein LQ341_002181 [Variospora aurantia]